jgi:hypothetical protein
VDILREMTVDCRPEPSAYLSELLAARDALNIVGPLDASMRLASSLTADGLLKTARTVSRDKVWDVANYAQVRQLPGIQAALAAAPDRNDPIAVTRFAILQTGLGLAPCPPGSLSSPNLESTRVAVGALASQLQSRSGGFRARLEQHKIANHRDRSGWREAIARFRSGDV